MTSYLRENEPENLQMPTSILLKFLILGWDISRTIWRIEVSDGSLFCNFHSFSFELKLFFDRRFPLKLDLDQWSVANYFLQENRL